MKGGKIMFGNIKYFHHACQNVVDNKKLMVLKYAANYARYGLTIQDVEEARVQAMYVLGNIAYWQGDIASETRSCLRNFIKVT